jgi:SOUL heme-binding protein
MRKKKLVWIAAVVVIALGAASWGPIVSNVEQPKYAVVEREDNDRNVEIRDYAPMIVAETAVVGKQRAAISGGFRIIAAYIFGDNVVSQNTAMTAPPVEPTSEKIAMTAPVTQQGDGATWKVRFVMPANYSMDTLPRPKNAAVKLKQISAKRFAVIRFSGMAGEDSLRRHTNELETFMKTKDLKLSSVPIYAFYNPPWTLPFLRRNEIMIEIAR